MIFSKNGYYAIIANCFRLLNSEIGNDLNEHNRNKIEKALEFSSP